MKIFWRGWRFSPLFIVGKHIFWFTNGIAFGKIHNCGDITYYCGWLIICKKTKHHYDFVERINDGTWPKEKLWIVKYSK